MTLSITFSSHDEFVRHPPNFPSKGASLELNFETEEEATRAKHALWISKFFPSVFRAFPDFQQDDPTQGLPREIREKAVRIFPKNAFRWNEEDVIGVVSSLYSEEDALVGSLVNVAWKSPLLHAYMLYHLLTAPALGFSVTYDSQEQKVKVNILINNAPRDFGFWIDCKQNQIQTFDLQTSLAGKGYLGIGIPLRSNLHREFSSDTEGNQREEYGDDFFENQVVNDWLIFHLKGEKVHRQSFVIDKRSKLSPTNGISLDRHLSTGEWMSAATV